MSSSDVPTSVAETNNVLYEQYAASIFAYLRLHTPSQQDAEDLLSEVFLAAFEQDDLSWLTAKQRFVWLRQVARNKLVDRHRRSLHISFLPLEQVIETICLEEALNPEHMLVRREELERLYEAIAHLSLLQQQILQLRLGDRLRFAEIAALLEKREEAIRKTFSRTLAILRTHYATFQKGDRS